MNRGDRREDTFLDDKDRFCFLEGACEGMRERRQTTLPRDVFQAAGLKINDQVDWRFEDGEIRGRKLVPAERPSPVMGRLVRKGDALVMEIPKGYKGYPEDIAKAVREERDSR